MFSQVDCTKLRAEMVEREKMIVKSLWPFKEMTGGKFDRMLSLYFKND